MSRGYDEGNTILDFKTNLHSYMLHQKCKFKLFAFIFSLLPHPYLVVSLNPLHRIQKALRIAVSGPELSVKSGLKSYSFGFHSFRKRVPPLFY